MTVQITPTLLKKVDAIVRPLARYVPDEATRDSWTSYAKNVRAGKTFRGDCDDWAQTTLEILHDHGVPKKHLYRALVVSEQSKGNAIDHMIGLVKTNDGSFWCVGDTFGPPEKVVGSRVHGHKIVRTSRVGELDVNRLPLWRYWNKKNLTRQTNTVGAGMKTSNQGLAFIKKHEKLVLRVYDDKNPTKTLKIGDVARGTLTAGYGHTGADVQIGMPVTQAKATAWFKQDIETAEQAVYRAIRVSLDQHQFDALVSFVFNVGEPNFAKSTLVKKINGRKPEHEIEAQFRRWIYSGGEVMNGLVRRRNDEATMWSSGVVASGPVTKVMQPADISPAPTVEEDKSALKSKDVMALGGATSLGSVTFLSEIRQAISEFNESIDIGLVTSLCGAALAIIGAYLLYKRIREITVEARR